MTVAIEWHPTAFKVRLGWIVTEPAGRQVHLVNSARALHCLAEPRLLGMCDHKRAVIAFEKAAQS